ncbi:hydroxyacylglutathione hydrolase [Pseudidiomarina aestuarii]|uniref:Hydroxyacylglutathione hydrolase n=1 Tax=Pseudidiomarina aestuarii TaxID=624146 RepID=A0A7Z6ZSU9_9GAMM|nr:hydroxyacylglutathione hydrolase [Pseudidiomarina aestuarii]RUO40759.1 hydroxyacylglutathione hydrolase [Pseudidiomarina aestuarii]
MLVTALPAFTDNYIWLARELDSQHVVVVDPGDEKPVLDYLQAHQLTLSAILITHHHWDHTDGLLPLLEHFDVPVYGPVNPKIQGVTERVQDGDRVSVPGLDEPMHVIETPGHTLDHISFYNTTAVFCGDTLFAAGCGRMFEGNPEQYYQSLQRLGELPADTKVYCAHEYTAANVKFAAAAEPNNTSLREFAQWVTAQRQQNQITLPTTIEQEWQINPFLRAQSVAEFAQRRQWKDKF